MYIYVIYNIPTIGILWDETPKKWFVAGMVAVASLAISHPGQKTNLLQPNGCLSCHGIHGRPNGMGKSMGNPWENGDK